MENEKIKNSQITVSSTFHRINSGKSARLHRNILDWGAWCPNITTAGKENIYYDEYIQIDLLHLTTITKVATQGREFRGGLEFVKTYQISYSYDNKNWMYYREKSSDVKVNIVKTGHDEYDRLCYLQITCYLQHSRLCCIRYTISRLRLELVYPIQHGH